MNIGGRECRIIHILIVGDGVRIPAGQFIYLFIFLFSFLKQSFKRVLTLKLL